MGLLHIQSNNEFIEQIINHSGVCIVDFYADWCGPCKMQTPILEELQNEMPDLPIAKINVDELADLAQQYQIRTIPSILVFKEGKLSNQVAGVQTIEALKTMIAKA